MQIQSKITLTSLVMLLSFSSIAEPQVSDIEQEVNDIIAILSTNPDSAIIRSEHLVELSKNQNHEYGLVQGNFLLGYIYDKIEVNFAKSIVYYLEGVRYASQSSYPNAPKNEIALRKNCGVIYRKFKAFDLAIDQYKEALAISTALKDSVQIIDIAFNLSGVYADMNKTHLAIELLEDFSMVLTPKHDIYFDLHNRLAQFYIDTNQWDKALKAGKKGLLEKSSSPIEKVDSYLIVSRVKLEEHKLDESATMLQEALLTTESINDDYSKHKSQFECNLELGKIYSNENNLAQAKESFLSAIRHLSYLDHKPNYYKAYKEIASVYFNLGDFSRAKQYEDLYSDALNNYLKTQEEIQNQNQKYNMDLITMRYYDEVAKQERIASILFYTKVVSLGLLILLLGVVGYHRYEKYKLRKDIMRELSRHKLIG